MSTYAIEIADKALAVLQATPFDPVFKTFKRTPMRQVAPTDLPLLGVYILRETRSTDGDANAGEPRFFHRLHLGIAGAVSAADDGSQFTTLESMMAQIDERLLTSPAFISMIEGVEQMDRRSQYAIMGETPLAEIQIEIIVTFRTYWPPVIPDDYRTLHVETRYPSKDTDPARVRQVIEQYDVEQN
ncbi:hypothetical protein LRP30_13580 [Bradyrhizobium sp. C-145]|uniref:hypothetical protein n=1 Tax=Bradyrhizobium sp. C-145 TaxID=574727 RepID=UPI00201B5C73|nr:hypothetical protein [Bradyrhizobium sp. C-145]UQR66213.1 hypothetical protein LRP30_13580 [Bradyrhizobium sp. C-145]